LERTGDQLLTVLGALSNAHRLRLLARLKEEGPRYVSQLARDAGISRPLLYLHLQKLEEAGLVTSRFELSRDGKALKFYEAADFSLLLNPDVIQQMVKTLTTASQTPKKKEGH